MELKIKEENLSTAFASLKDYQKKKILEHVINYLSINKRNENRSFDCCPKCGGKDARITKYGKTRKGKQILYCHSCGKTFVEDIGKPSFYSWYDSSVWESFISDTISGQTLAYSEEKYDIDHATAWRWRHKIMEAVSALEDPILLGKSAEVDEKYFRKSHKGKRIDGVKAKKRGTPASKRGISKEKICVLTGVDRSKVGFAKAYSMGKPTREDVKNIHHHFVDGTFFWSDSTNCYDGMFKEKHSQFRKLKDTSSYNSVNHLNTVNSLHSFMEGRFQGCKGVAMKYINRYVAFWTQLFSYSGKTLEEKTALLELLFRPEQKGILPLMNEIRSRGLFLLADETA